MGKTVTERYPFTRDFEEQIAFAVAARPQFYEKLGYAIDPERMPSDEAKVLVLAAQEFAREAGAPPNSTTVTLQLVRKRVADGKASYEDFEKAVALITAAGPRVVENSVEALMTAAIPLVRKVEGDRAFRESIPDIGQGNMEKVAARFDRVAKLGKHRSGSAGFMLQATQEHVSALLAETQQERLPTGIVELDEALEGGLELPGLGLVMAGPGDGKSFFLCQIAVEALLTGIDVAYMTLEMSEASIARRIYQNLTGIGKEEMGVRQVEVSRRLGLLQEDGLGKLAILYESPRVTTPAVLMRWLDDLEREKKMHPTMVIVDYADKMRAGRSSKDRKLYDEMEEVYEVLRSGIGVARGCRVWTASQTNRESVRKKHLDNDAVSDAMGKVRVPDLVVAAERAQSDVDDDTIRFRVTKRREDGDGQAVGPLPRDCGRGRIVAVTRSAPWDPQVNF